MRSLLSGRCATPPLVLEEVIAGFGAITILDCVSLSLGVAEVVTVLGANAAGKTTLLRAIAGITLPRRGSIRLFGEPIQGGHRTPSPGLGSATFRAVANCFPACLYQTI